MNECANYQFIIKLINIELNIIMKFSINYCSVIKELQEFLCSKHNVNFFSVEGHYRRGDWFPGSGVLLFCFFLVPLGCWQEHMWVDLQGHPGPASHPECAVPWQAHSLSPSPVTVSLHFLKQAPHTPALMPPCWQADAPAPCAHQPQAACTVTVSAMVLLIQTCAF